jgi:hypothetical protein
MVRVDAFWADLKALLRRCSMLRKNAVLNMYTTHKQAKTTHIICAKLQWLSSKTKHDSNYNYNCNNNDKIVQAWTQTAKPPVGLLRCFFFGIPICSAPALTCLSYTLHFPQCRSSRINWKTKGKTKKGLQFANLMTPNVSRSLLCTFLLVVAVTWFSELSAFDLDRRRPVIEVQ